MSVELLVDGQKVVGEANELLIDILLRRDAKVPRRLLPPAARTDRNLRHLPVEINGQLARACATHVTDGMIVQTKTPRADAAQREGFDRLLKDHMLYCTVCDNNNGNCTVQQHDKRCSGSSTRNIRTSEAVRSRQQQSLLPLRPEPVHSSAPRCVEACQNVEVNETLSINWDDPHPRVLWDGGKPIGESSCVSCGHCVTVCPCNALMEKSMIGKAGYMSGLPHEVLNPMIDIIKGIEPDMGYGSILKVSEAEIGHARFAHEEDQDGLHLLRRRLQLRGVDARAAHPEDPPNDGPTNGISHLHQGQIRLGLREQQGAADLAAHPRKRRVPQGPPGTRRSISSRGASPRSRRRTAPTRSPSSPPRSARMRKAT